MEQRNTSGSRNCWGTARERERMRARFSIRERVASLEESESELLDDRVRAQANQCVELSSKECDRIKVFLRQVVSGSTSSFSLSKLSKHHYLLSRPVNNEMLSTYKIETLCTSRFGRVQTEKVQKCVNILASCTIMEYATWLGEYRIVGSLLMGGVDPTVRGLTKRIFCKESIHGNDQTWKERAHRIEAKVVKRFFVAFPCALKVYIVKRVVDMRTEGLLSEKSDSICSICGIAQFVTPLNFGAPCFHFFCEHCLWEDIIGQVDARNGGDVVLCPICHESPKKTSTLALSDDLSGRNGTPLDQYQASLTRFESLPTNTKELKARPKKKSSKKGIVCSSWGEAVVPSLGTSQDVRRDKWFAHTERNAFHYVKGCIICGIDVNFLNSYGQTALYIAAWKGYCNLVTLLLEYGADATICSYGGGSALCAAEASEHMQIVNSLKQWGAKSVNSSFPSYVKQPSLDGLVGPKLTPLIDPGCNHPGAGAFYIDNAIQSRVVNWLIELRKSLPADLLDKKKVRQEKCSQRFYYCDAEENMCSLLSETITRSGSYLLGKRKPFVFPHMRFLHYDHPGSVLAPHIDLCRVDQHSERRSTHTFILYLHDCAQGGETSLLGGVSGEKRNKVLAKVEPREGRLLLFPHACPHEGNEVLDVPKCLLRGEVILS